MENLSCKKAGGAIPTKYRSTEEVKRILSMEIYNVETYQNEIMLKGIDVVWEEILKYCKETNNTDSFLSIKNFGDLYEIGLAFLSKENKKENGVYYTPNDVCILLSSYFKDLKGENICDVCCGTGNLIISYLSTLTREEALNIINSGKLYLYDLDSLALKICIESIAILYNLKDMSTIHSIAGDFLNKTIKLPKNSKVISNPPYYKISTISKKWEESTIVKDSKELYTAFMEKIIKQSESSVTITPFSFIGGNKFYSFRCFLNDYNGKILSFDNVPGNIFNGKKHGVFNTNTSNAVRAAITIVENIEDKQGFIVSPLFRFLTSEREFILDKKILSSYLSEDYQVISTENKKYCKCFNELLLIYNTWIDESSNSFKSLLSDKPTDYILHMPKTCRYFVSATQRSLNRDGKSVFYFKDLISYEYAYCLLNSSFAYMYWRIFDGAITYADGLLKELPIFLDMLSSQDKKNIHDIVTEMVEKEKDFLVYKKNASKIQENVKFPKCYSKKLNQTFLDILKIDIQVDKFDVLHSNSLLSIGKEVVS
ncbi:MAG: N-6 DNA methylase [Anaerovoracaceae bacterium]